MDCQQPKIITADGGPIWQLNEVLTVENPHYTITVTTGFECNGLWLLKNSLGRNPQKKDRVRMPYKRLSPFC